MELSIELAQIEVIFLDILQLPLPELVYCNYKGDGDNDIFIMENLIASGMYDHHMKMTSVFILVMSLLYLSQCLFQFGVSYPLGITLNPALK